MAAVVWGVPLALNALANAQILWWVYLMVLVVALVTVSALIPALRRATWGRLPLRVTTVKRREAFGRLKRQEALDSLSEQARPIVADAVKKADERRQVSRAQSEKDTKEAFDLGFQHGQATATPAKPVVPLPKPRWRVYFAPRQPDDQTTRMVLENLMPRSAAHEVRLDASAELFRVTSAGQWEDLSGEAKGEFLGVSTAYGDYNGITFHISWYDESGSQQQDTYELPSISRF